MNKQTLIEAWCLAKATEQRAISARRNIESQLIELAEKKDEGSVSETVGDYKMTVTYKLNRSVDSAALGSSWDCLSPAAKAAFKWSADVSAPKLRELPQEDSSVISQFITTKPASPSFKIEEVKK